MLALESTAYLFPWFLEVTISGHTATYDGYGADAVEAAQYLVAWLAHASRPWAPSTWSWELTPNLAGTGSSHLTLFGSASMSVDDATSDGGPLGLEAGLAGSTVTATFPAVGTWSPSGGLGLRRRYAPAWSGDATGSGAVASPGTWHNKPDLTAVGTPLDAGRLSSQLALCPPGPRRGKVMDHTGEWVQLQIGKVDRSPVGYSFYRHTFDVVEEV